MRSIFRNILIAAATVAIASCGGGGGGPSNGPGIGPNAVPTITITPESTTVPKAFYRQFTARVTRSDGLALSGAVITATVNPAQGDVSRSDDVTTTAVDEFFRVGSSITATTASDGTMSFFFHSNETTGPVTVTVSGVDTNRSYQATQTFTVLNEEPPFRQVSIVTQLTSMPVNPGFIPGPQGNSPFQIEGQVVVRRKNGQQYANASQGTSSQNVNVSVAPAGIGVFSTPDLLNTPQINEYLTLLVSGPILLNAGSATFYLHSLTLPGVFTMNASFFDPDTNRSITVSRNFTVVGAVPRLPAQVAIATDGRPVYVQASGANTTTQLTVNVTDGVGNGVPNTPTFNNLLLEVIRDGSGTGETLTGLSFNGAAANGQSIRVGTVNGIAGAAFRAGTGAGIVNLRATADRADNNVDNGIQDPVISIRPIVVSDGVLFALELTRPDTDVLLRNPVNDRVTSDNIRPGPSGTYSLRITALASDRQGNPVVQNTPITFGSIDEPLTGYPQDGSGSFVIAGTDGDPQEGGRTFVSPLQGRFIIPGGQGAGPGDTLLVRGEESPGNVDLENARRIQSIQSATQLTTFSRFNFNDVTGVSVNNLAVLSYQIGRAQDGNIRSNLLTVATDERGEATTELTYPVQKLNKRVIVWAQGAGDIVQGSSETVEDIEDYVFFGAAPATLTAAPTEIDAAGVTPVTICLFDNFSSPIPAVQVEGGVNSTTADFQIRIDGQLTPPPARLRNRTGTNGCVVAQVEAAALPGSAQIIVFRVPGTNLTAQVTIRPPRGARLRVSPVEIRGDDANFRAGAPVAVVATLTTNLNLAIPNANINATCRVTRQPVVAGNSTPNAQIRVTPSDRATNSTGAAEFAVSVSGLDALSTPGAGVCTFAVDVGGSVTTALSVDIPVNGVDLCSLAINRDNPICSVPRLTVRVAGACAGVPAVPGGPGNPPNPLPVPERVATCTVTSTPAGILVTHPNAQTVPFPPRANGQAESVVLFATKTLTGTGAVPSFGVTFSGDCATSGNPSSNQSAPIQMNVSKTCTVTVQ